MVHWRRMEAENYRKAARWLLSFLVFEFASLAKAMKELLVKEYPEQRGCILLGMKEEYD